jgi:hypothetical protein
MNTKQLFSSKEIFTGRNIILVSSLFLNLLLIILISLLYFSPKTLSITPASFQDSNIQINNLKFYIVNSENNIEYKETFTNQDAISVTYKFTVPNDTYVIKNRLTRNGTTKLFEFEIPLTGNGERKFILPKQSEVFESGEYIFEIVNDKGDTILKNNFKVN